MLAFAAKDALNLLHVKSILRGQKKNKAITRLGAEEGPVLCSSHIPPTAQRCVSIHGSSTAWSQQCCVAVSASCKECHHPIRSSAIHSIIVQRVLFASMYGCVCAGILIMKYGDAEGMTGVDFHRLSALLWAGSLLITQ